MVLEDMPHPSWAVSALAKLAQTKQADMLSYLPIDMIREILEYFRPLEKDQMRPNDFDGPTRQRENQDRLDALRAFSLTSKGLHTVVEPFFYSTLILRSPKHHKRLVSFMSVVLEHPERAKYIKYIETSDEYINNFAAGWPYRNIPESAFQSKGKPTWVQGDNIGPVYNDIWLEHRPLAHQAATRIWWDSTCQSIFRQLLEEDPAQAMLLLILSLAPNITHIALAAAEGFPWHLVFNPGVIDAPVLLQPCGTRMKTLRLHVDDIFDDAEAGETWFSEVTASLHELSELQCLDIVGLEKNHAPAMDLRLPTLSALHLSLCDMTPTAVSQLIRSASSLKHFSYQAGPYSNHTLDDFAPILDALIPSRGTLESLSLLSSPRFPLRDTRPPSIINWTDAASQTYLQHFTALKTLEIDAGFSRSVDQVMLFLPKSLELATFIDWSVQSKKSAFDVKLTYPEHLPKLRAVRILNFDTGQVCFEKGDIVVRTSSWSPDKGDRAPPAWY